ncbi:MAG: T9SS type B sorting domain-containing protein, partial [Flavobacteriaceae bacterium]|nr:T9SS type B sorting domain-containing protein [Flavobacteriaceae bacterium]
IELQYGFEVETPAQLGFCEGESATITTDITPYINDGFNQNELTFSWFKDSELIEGENTNQIEVTEEGLYTVSVNQDSNPDCGDTDATMVTVYDRPIVEDDIPNIEECGDFTYTQSFDLTQINENTLNLEDPENVNASYYLTEVDAEEGNDPIESPENYQLPFGVDEQTIFIRLQNTPETGDCAEVYSFNLILLNVEIGTNPLPPLEECETNPNGEPNPFDLTQQNELVLGPNQNMQDYSISYFEDLADANGGSNPIEEPSQYAGDTNTIFVKIQHLDNPECFEVGQFDLNRIENIDFTGIVDINQCGDFSYNQGFNLISNTLNIFEFNNEENIENISYFVTEQDAINGENAINNLVQYSLPNGIDQQTIYVRVRKTDEFNSCLSFSSFELRLFNVEIANPLPDLIECITDGSETFTFDLTQQNGLILGGNQEAVDYSIAYFTSEDDANNGINSIETPEAYEAEEETIWVRIENLNGLDFDEECFEIGEFSVEAVQPATVNLDLDPLEECDTNNDNFSSEFDLDALIPIINFLELDVNISFHLTEADAASGNSPLSSPFQNVSDDIQTIWIRVEDDDSGCTQFTTVELITYDTPQTQEVDVLEECAISDTNFAQVFDITLAETQLLMNVTDTENITIDYYINEDSAINQTTANQINNPDAYLSQTNQDNLEQIVYVRVTNSESPIDCFSVEPITLRVNPLPDFTPPSLLAVCKDDTSGTSGQIAVFDLTSKNSEITNNNANLAVTYYTDEEAFEDGIAIENPESYTNVVNPQSIFVEIIAADTGCSTTTNLTLVVSPNPTIPQPEPLVECDPGDNGFAAFDLAAAVEDILANEVEAAISFHETEQQAQNNTNPIAFEDEDGNSILYENENPFLQTLFVRASNTGNSNQLGTNCFVVRAIDLIVEPSPSIIDLEDLVSCDDATPNGFTSFDLTVNEALIIGDQDASSISVTYHLTQANAEEGIQQIAVPQNFTNFTNPQEIFVRVESDDLGCSNANNSFSISVEPRPEIALTTSYEYVCADPNDAQALNNEIATFDLTLKDEEINPAFGDPNTEVRYYASEEDFEAGIFIENPNEFQNTENPQLIFAEVVNLDNQCPSFTAVEFEFHVHPLPLVDIGNMDGAAICVDPLTGELTDPDNLPILDTELDNNAYEFVWFLDGEELEDETDNFLVAFVPGLYEVEVTDIGYSLRTECFKISQAEIIESSGPLFEVNVISEPFDGNHTIEIINIQGNGDYEFSVDGGPWIPQNNQQQIIVSGLELGEVSVVGRDRNGCGESVNDVTIIDYPKFFTPNNDGFNDSWNIVGLENQPEANIYIFDRYGKLLKQIKPNAEGWDGTYNGKPMPSNDYWFKVEYIAPRTGSQKTFKSNFTLKR